MDNTPYGLLKWVSSIYLFSNKYPYVRLSEHFTSILWDQLPSFVKEAVIAHANLNRIYQRPSIDNPTIKNI